MGVFLAAALLLGLERLCYIWVWHAPAHFRAWCEREPLIRLGGCVDALRLLFIGFKLLQIGVFAGWCLVHGGSLTPAVDAPIALAIGAAALAFGQWLNATVFLRLGQVGVFYGNRFGHRIPWCRAFPFSWFAHPQYLGAVLSVWGLFLVMRFPHGDWYLLPALETAYYMLGARFEQ